MVAPIEEAAAKLLQTALNSVVISMAQQIRLRTPAPELYRHGGKQFGSGQWNGHSNTWDRGLRFALCHPHLQQQQQHHL